MTAPKSREGQPNPDADIVEAALERHPLGAADERMVWDALHREGRDAHWIADGIKDIHPAFAQVLREGIAARRGQRSGKHGGKG